jgi:hypothetical protein
MFPIASAISTGSTALFSFTNIPQTFTHLQVRWYARSLGSGVYSEQFTYFINNDRSSIYTSHTLWGDGSSALSINELLNASYVTLVGTSMPNANSIANAFGVVTMDILDYTNTNKNKTIRSFLGWDLNGSGLTGLSSALYTTTNAINRIDLGVASGSNYAAGSRADLYGIQTSNATGA